MYKTVMKIDGMVCGMCESHINSAIRRAFAVKKVASSRRKGETVLVTAEWPDEAELRRVIGETGYTLVLLETTEE